MVAKHVCHSKTVLQERSHLFGLRVAKFLCHGNLRDLERNRLGHLRWHATPEHGRHWLPRLTPVSWNPGKVVVGEPLLYFRLCMSFSKHSHTESILYLAILYTLPRLLRLMTGASLQGIHDREMQTVKVARSSSAAWDLTCDDLCSLRSVPEQLLSDKQETDFLCTLAQAGANLTERRVNYSPVFPQVPRSRLYLQDHSVLQRCLRRCLELVA